MALITIISHRSETLPAGTIVALLIPTRIDRFDPYCVVDVVHRKDVQMKFMQKMKNFFDRFDKALLIFCGAGALTFVLLTLDFNLLEANLYDFRMAHGFQLKADPSIVLVTIDDVSAKMLNESAPLPLDMHAKFLESLAALHPRGVGYLVDMNQVNQLNPDLIRSEWSSRFIEAAHKIQENGGAVLLGTPYDVTGEVLPPYPLSSLPHSVAVIHKDGNVFAEDKITRRALVELNDKDVFHFSLAQMLGIIGHEENPIGSYLVPEIESEYFFFRYHGDPVLHQKIPYNLPYERVSFASILRGEVAPETLIGKIVLVGSLSRDDSTDFAFTPYSKSPFSTPKIVIHANILDSIIHHQGMVRPSSWINALTTFAATAFVLWWVLNSTPLAGVFSTLGLALIWASICQIFFQEGIWIRESQPLVGVFVGYYLVVPYRLIREYKKRSDYQRQNEVLTQVEELKTNFLSLVTHDLKTPVARIQGLAEVLLSKASERLVDRDKETVAHIIDSTEELNRFITSILELSKAESNDLRLNFESKDINQLIERAVEGFKAPARSKKIKIITKLEPLFPIKIDASLILKVINNLIDNSLKYSAAGSEVAVESCEMGDEIEILIRDQGIGMSPEERERLFTRFYRAKNDTTTKIAGTGLGLYLTKFFIESHHGRVEVESEKDVGTTFKIYLPIHATAAQVVEESTIGLTRRITSVWMQRQKLKQNKTEKK